MESGATLDTVSWADPLTPHEFRMMAEIGLVAAGRGWLDQASRIFNALIELSPASSLPHIGLALALLNSSRPEEAIRVLERAEGLVSAPHSANTALQMSDPRDDSALIRAFHGVALKLSGRTSESFRILRGLTERPADDHAGRIARRMLGLPDQQEA
jgi:tetratricopeptide (TPR) repeat protein